MSTVSTVPGVPVVFRCAQKRSWSFGIPRRWNPTCGCVLVWLVATLTFHPDLALADVTLSVVLLSCTSVTVPPLPTVNFAVLPFPGAGLFVVLFGPQVMPDDAAAGVAAIVTPPRTTATAST